jgi:SAM-dependent methyltransferase
MSLSRINVGCGSTPTPGWVNLDNSPTVLLGRAPGLVQVLGALRVLDRLQRDFAGAAGASGIRWASAQRLPVPDASAEVVYSSHMIEHLDRTEARRFFAEARRVLAPGGILRLGAPDLALLVQQYQESGDADRFVASTLMAHGSARTLRERLRLLLLGYREHAWMYDAASLVRLVTEEGFTGATALPPGQTTIPDPGPLDLRERAGETVYVEACRA